MHHGQTVGMVGLWLRQPEVVMREWCAFCWVGHIIHLGLIVRKVRL